MLDFEIKVLQNNLLDYEAWITHVQTVTKFINGKDTGILLFPNPNIIISNKINKCFERMVREYESKNEALSDSLTDEEKVNLITSQEGYKNREQKEAIDINLT